MMPSLFLSEHRFLLRASLALGNIFAWILFFHALYFTGESASGALIIVVAGYAAVQILTFLLTPLSAANLPHGSARTMLLATLAQAAAFLWLATAATGALGPGSVNLWWGMVGFVLLSGLYRAFYWVPYAVAKAESSLSNSQTRFLLEVFLTLLPVSAALVITSLEHGTWLLFVGAGVIAFFAALPLVRISDTYERFDFSYLGTFEALFSWRYRDALKSSWFDGVHGAGLLFVWPLAIFLLLDWSYFKVGAVVSLTLVLVLLLRRHVRGLLRKIGAGESHRVNSALTASSWVLRIFVFSPVTVVLADTIYHLGAPARRFGIDPIAYEQASDGAHYVDELTAFKEMGSALGRICLCCLVAVVALFSSPLVALGGGLFVAGLASIYSVSRSYERL